MIYRFEEMKLTQIIEVAFLGWIKILQGPVQRNDLRPKKEQGSLDLSLIHI